MCFCKLNMVTQRVHSLPSSLNLIGRQRGRVTPTVNYTVKIHLTKWPQALNHDQAICTGFMKLRIDLFDAHESLNETRTGCLTKF